MNTTIKPQGNTSAKVMKIPNVVTEVPGPRSLALYRREEKALAPGVQSIASRSKIVLDHGEGSLLTDVDGNTFIDFSAGVGVGSLGHSHPAYRKALKEQLDRVTVGSFTTEARVELVHLLAELAPGDLGRTQLYSGGAEAAEAGLRLAKSFTGNYEFLGFWGGFHGKTGGVLGLMGSDWKKSLGPLMPGLTLAPYAECYRCPFDKTFPECNFHCVDYVRQAIEVQTTGQLAALVVEPMQGTAGNVIPPPGYLARLKEVAQGHGALLIVDEMLTGCGRTGTMFACEQDAVVPDILLLGKGLASGYPVSAIMTTEEIAHAKPFADPSGSSSSYGGNPLAAAAALVTLQTILSENLVENAREVGALMLDRLKALEIKYPFIGDVRGRGLFIGLELVKDKDAKEPLDSETTNLIFEEALRRGLLLMGYSHRIRINPALNISREIASAGIEVLDEVFDCIKRKIAL
ncbi:MAG: aspartate aminotransferase family protein [Nitrospinota bacterium]